MAIAILDATRTTPAAAGGAATSITDAGMIVSVGASYIVNLSSWRQPGTTGSTWNAGALTAGGNNAHPDMRCEFFYGATPTTGPHTAADSMSSGCRGSMGFLTLSGAGAPRAGGGSTTM